ncbi:MAG: T9SS type A sorting domain-containing protein [Candidatus Cloacimonetes bacterium]|nr:T9SS type A sorting domain-containing protein [Candidatus Cloacimonadota bacterium]
MKKIFLILVLFTLFIRLISLEFSEINSSFKISGSFEVDKINTEQIEENTFDKIIISNCESSLTSNAFELPVYSRLVSLPPTGNYKSTNIEYNYDEIVLSNKIASKRFNEQEDIYAVDEWFPEDIIVVGKPAIMRGNRFSQISISPIQYNPKQNTVRVLKNIEIDFEIDYSDNRNPLTKDIVSSHFNNIASKKILGANSRISSVGGEYLFIAPSSVESILQPLLRWKEKLGFNTKLALIDDIGTTAEDIKAYLQNAYDTWENPPEFVILVGDVSGVIQCPAFFVEGYLTPWDVSDHNYTLLDGDDYFPDIFIGRLSVQSQMELMTVISKIINYERNPFVEIPWQKRALMVGHVEEWNGYSQREILMGIRNKLLDFEYTTVDTFISPWQQGNTQLANIISEGESFVCYRGAGSPSYWSGGYTGPMFTIDDIDLLNNGFMLPLVTSMTCGGGDFASEQFTTCFGEKWITCGNPSEPFGAIGFIGPSEYDTKTWFNNANAMGIYQGITQEGLFRCGEMLLRGKMELYNNYPQNHAWGGSLDSDQFYFYVYNLLGDPGLQILTDIPKELELIYDTEIPNSANFIEVQLNNFENDLAEFTIAITSENSLMATGITDANGIAIIPINLPAGDYEVTASKYCYIPLTDNLIVNSNASLILENFSFSEQLISGQNSNLEFTFANIGIADIENITIMISCDNENISFSNSLFVLSLLEAGQNYSDELEIQVSEGWNDGEEVQLFLDITSDSGDYEFLILSEIISPELIVSEFLVQNSTNCLIQNETADITIELLNCGNYQTGNFQAELICINENAVIENVLANYVNIQQNETGTVNFTIIPENVITGELAQFEMVITNNDNILYNISFNFPIGIIDSTSVTFCENGYYAIESSDVGNFNAPEYDWIEIDPNYGGDGSLLNSDHTTQDGFTKVIPLPFQFNYFGNFYDHISVCSEGYISMDPTPLIFHRNRNIPSGVGPAGMIAPFWDNLIDGRIYVKYDEENNYFVIEWSDFKNEFDETDETFQVILYDPEFYFTATENKLIKFQYKEVNNNDQDNNFATVGIENYQQTDGLLITFSNIYPITTHELQNQTAILFLNNTDSGIPFISTAPENYNFSIPADSTFSVDLNLSNALGSSEVFYEVSLAHFARVPSDYPSNFNEDFSRSIEGNFIINLTPPYIPIVPLDFHFYLVHPNVDGEGIQGITIDFPPGFYVNSATNIGELEFNNEIGDGAELSWGFETGISIPPSSSGIHIFVNVTIDENQTSPVEINWYIEGDGTGATPHQVSGSFIVNPTSDEYLWVTYPNGGESVVPSIQDTLRWNKYGDAEFVKIMISKDNMISWQMINEMTENSGSYPYMFDGPLSNECRIKISTLDEDSYDISDSLFTISAFNITQPEEASTLSYGVTDTLTWIDTGNYDNVKIEFSANNGYSWETISETEENTGSFVYTVPGPPSEYCLFQISNITGTVQNISRPFTIVDSPVNWLSIENTLGIIPAGGNVNNSITISSNELTPATYVAVIKIITDIGQILNIPITLEVYTTIPPIENYVLKQNYPNPFNPFTRIEYDVPKAGKITIKIYNIKGQYVKTLINEYKELGAYETYWDGTDDKNRNVSSGVYLYQLESDNATKTNKMILIK